jgi:hypothetical protein
MNKSRSRFLRLEIIVFLPIAFGNGTRGSEVTVQIRSRKDGFRVYTGSKLPAARKKIRVPLFLLPFSLLFCFDTGEFLIAYPDTEAILFSCD